MLPVVLVCALHFSPGNLFCLVECSTQGLRVTNNGGSSWKPMKIWKKQLELHSSTLSLQQMAHACHVAVKPGDLSMVCRNGLTKRKQIKNPVQARNSPNVANISVDANEWWFLGSKPMLPKQDVNFPFRNMQLQILSYVFHSQLKFWYIRFIRIN